MACKTLFVPLARGIINTLTRGMSNTLASGIIGIHAWGLPVPRIYRLQIYCYSHVSSKHNL